jgi:hypothetical protein
LLIVAGSGYALRGALTGSESPTPIVTSGWSFYKIHQIGSAQGAGIDYQINLTVHYGAGEDGPYDVYLNGHVRPDFGDIRFTASDGRTQLPYWIQSATEGDQAPVWVKVPDDLSENGTTIYLYYGDSNQTSASDGSKTFLLFDDFNESSLDPSVWSSQIGNWTLVNGTAVGTVGDLGAEVNPYGNQGAELISGAVFADVRVVARTTLVTADDPGIRIRRNDLNVYYQQYDSRHPGFQYEELLQDNDTNDTMIGSYAPFDSGTSYHVYAFAAAGEHLLAWIDGSNLVSATDSTLADGNVSLRFWGNSHTSGAVDWVFATKFVLVEPSQGSWSDETANNSTHSSAS